MKPFVIIESPYRGDVEPNLDYARRCCRDSFNRGEQPFASHLFYPQFLNDDLLKEREAGIGFGYALWNWADKITFYCDRGWSTGMLFALRRIAGIGRQNWTIRALYTAPIPLPDPTPTWLEDLFKQGFTFRCE